MPVRTMALLALLVSLAGCSLSNRINNYEARFKDDSGTDYQIFNRRGALLEIEKPDGTKIVADDRGHAAQPSILSQAATLLLMRETK